MAVTLAQIKGAINGVTLGWNHVGGVDSTKEQALVDLGITERRQINHNNDCTCSADGTGFTKGPYLDTTYQAITALTGVTRIVDCFTYLPTALRTDPPGTNDHYTVNDWAAFRTYVKGYLDYIYANYGVNNIYLEFGNESFAIDFPDNESWWDATEGVSITSGTPAGEDRFTAYMTAYGHMSTAITQWRAANPTKTIYLGGPSANNAFADWQTQGNRVQDFYDTCISSGYVCDFISCHLYGWEQAPDSTTKTFTELLTEMIDGIRSQDSDIPVFVTEVGMRGISGVSGVYGQRGLQMAYYCDVSKMLAAQTCTAHFLLPYSGSSTDISQRDYWYYYDRANSWDTTPSYKALAILQGLSGTYVEGATFSARTGAAEPSGIVVQQSDGSYVACLWNYAGLRHGSGDATTYKVPCEILVTISGTVYKARRYKSNGGTSWIGGSPVLQYGGFIYAELWPDSRLATTKIGASFG